MSDERLLHALNQIKKEDLISFHMPGHKGHEMMKPLFNQLLAYDITEIPGSDNLHDARGPIKTTEEAISQFYGSSVSKLLVNGSTVGLLSMILGCLDRGDSLLVNRNAHKSIYNAIEIGGFKPIYIMPQMASRLGIPIGFDVDTVRQCIEENPAIKAIVLTYPTYEGVTYDIQSIIDYCHERAILVLVDEAHGAHLCLSESFPKSSLDLGADCVVQSFHKTLPAVTQTGVIHFSQAMSQHHKFDRVLWYLKSLQTSSPSYMLMASMDYMLYLMENKGRELIGNLRESLVSFESQMASLEAFEILRLPGQDFSKVCLVIGEDYYNNHQNGDWLAKTLRESYHIQVEYASEHFCLLMTTMCQGNEDLNRLFEALKTINSHMVKSNQMVTQDLDFKEVYDQMCRKDTQCYLASEVQNAPYEWLPVEAALDRISLDYVVPYPPGIPIIVPGERIHGLLIQLYQREKKRTMSLKDDKIKVLKENAEEVTK